MTLSSPLSDLLQHACLWKTLYGTLVENQRDVILAADGNGAVVRANRSAQKRFGIAAGATIAQALPVVWPEAQACLADGLARSTFAAFKGEPRLRVDLYPLMPAKQLQGLMIVIAEDPEPEMREPRTSSSGEMNRELDAIIDSSSDGLFVCDGHGTVIRMNPASERIHNTGAEKILGRNMVDLIRQGFIDRSAALEAIENKRTVSLLQNKDNRKLISTATPVFNDAGDLIRVVVSERDITQIDNLQRRLEDQQAIKDQLQEQLAQVQRSVLRQRKIIARSPIMVNVLQQAFKVSKVNSSVLITGESGVGKGLVADLIHKNSDRADKPLIRINCGAIPETLIESELFGYEKGAFTGAGVDGKPGYLELANGGTLFLDEIAELPASAQVKLLRFLEDGCTTRLGATQSRLVDARILVATHRDLKQMVAAGTFRHDLYYRLNVIPLHLPPVRERKECLLPLIRHHIDYFARKTGTARRLSHAALDVLMAYTYPGNLRELMNICERAVVMSETELIDLQDLPKDVLAGGNDSKLASYSWSGQQSLKQILENVEKTVLVKMLQTHRSQSGIARALGASQPTIARRLKKYGLTASMSSRGA